MPCFTLFGLPFVRWITNWGIGCLLGNVIGVSLFQWYLWTILVRAFHSMKLNCPLHYPSWMISLLLAQGNHHYPKPLHGYAFFSIVSLFKLLRDMHKIIWQAYYKSCIYTYCFFVSGWHFCQCSFWLIFRLKPLIQFLENLPDEKQVPCHNGLVLAGNFTLLVVLFFIFYFTFFNITFLKIVIIFILWC